MSEVALTVIGVVNKSGGAEQSWRPQSRHEFGQPRLRSGWLPLPQAKEKTGESSPGFPVHGVTAEIPLTIPLPPVLGDG